MALFNNCKFTSTTAGAGAFGVGAAQTGFRTPAQAGVGDGDPVSYTARSADNTQWEYGHGTYHSAGPTISRDIPLGSTNSDLAVAFSAAPTVYLDVFAEDLLNDSYPLTNSDTGIPGQMAYDPMGHLYVAYGTNQWVKISGLTMFGTGTARLLLRDGVSLFLLRNGIDHLLLGH